MQSLIDLIGRFFPEPQASLLCGILLGIPLKSTPSFVKELKIVGLMHLVVLSGMNISILTTLVFDMTRAWGRRLSACISVGIIVSFVCFVGPQPPLIRAACMAVFAIIARYTGRRSLAIWNLFLALLVVIAFQPQWITSLSFQLSFGATLGIILFSGKQNTENTGLLSGIVAELRTSLAAQVFTTPLIFLAFRQISFIAPLANILVSWTIAPLMIAGILFLIFFPALPFVGAIPGYIAHGLLTFIILAVRTLSRFPFAFIQL